MQKIQQITPFMECRKEVFMKLNQAAAPRKKKKCILRGSEKWIMPQTAFHEKPIRRTKVVFPK